MLTPKEMLHKGIFGGTYFAELVDHKDFPEDWFKGLDESFYKIGQILNEDKFVQDKVRSITKGMGRERVDPPRRS